MRKRLLVALVGNPNVGKTTLLNALAGTNLKVGNWPGVTVEKKEASLTYGPYELTFVDLPGVYGLEPFSEDEKVTVSFLRSGKADLLVNVLDATNPERGLHLTLELLELGKPLLLVLNFPKEAEKLGIRLDEKTLEELLGVKVVKLDARNPEEVKKLLPLIAELYEKKPRPDLPYSAEFLNFLKTVEAPTLAEKLQKLLTDEKLKQEVKRRFRVTAEKLVEQERRRAVEKLVRAAVKLTEPPRRDLTDLIDAFVLHPVLGVLLFILV
ncbi:MAG: ferrous iron transporter B, partial [Aquificae bacterium]|nr:ferrous iron transporter B [Aquificota bacterium]